MISNTSAVAPIFVQLSQEAGSLLSKSQTGEQADVTDQDNLSCSDYHNSRDPSPEVSRPEQTQIDSSPGISEMPTLAKLRSTRSLDAEASVSVNAFEFIRHADIQSNIKMTYCHPALRVYTSVLPVSQLSPDASMIPPPASIMLKRFGSGQFESLRCTELLDFKDQSRIIWPHLTSTILHPFESNIRPSKESAWRCTASEVFFKTK